MLWSGSLPKAPSTGLAPALEPNSGRDAASFSAEECFPVLFEVCRPSISWFASSICSSPAYECFSRAVSSESGKFVFGRCGVFVFIDHYLHIKDHDERMTVTDGSASKFRFRSASSPACLSARWSLAFCSRARRCLSLLPCRLRHFLSGGLYCLRLDQSLHRESFYLAFQQFDHFGRSSKTGKFTRKCGRITCRSYCRAEITRLRCG